jgi:hypothetical protein
MNRMHGLALALLILTALPAAAETLEAGPFTLEVGPELVLRVDGQTLFEGDRCVAFRGLKPDVPLLVDPSSGEVLREGNVVTTIAARDRNTFRREVMVTADAVHITWQMRIFGATGGSHLQYDLLTPGEFLDGAQYQAWTGRPRGPLQTETGTFSLEESEPLEYLVRTGRYLTIDSGNAQFSLDLNPAGPWVGESNYGENYSANPWHDGSRFHFMSLCAGGSHGGIFRGKVIIRPGLTPYEEIHSTAEVAYTRGFPPSLAVNFSEAADPTGQYEAYAPGENYRWRDPEAVRIIEHDGGGLLYRDAAVPSETGAAGVLELSQRSGHYLLTLNMRDPEQAIGPFTVASPDGPLFEDVTVEAGQYWYRTAPLGFRDGQATLRFSGDWAIGALTLQPILYATEDFVLDRPFWNMPIGPAAGE